MRRMVATMLVLGLAAAGCGMRSPSLAAEGTGSDDKGQDVYQAERCWMCHSIEGEGNKKNPLDGVGSKLTPAELRKWIVSPREMKSDTKMKAYKELAAADLDALVTYLASLKQKE